MPVNNNEELGTLELKAAMENTMVSNLSRTSSFSTEETQARNVDLLEKIESLENKVDVLARVIDKIFGKSVLINGSFVDIESLNIRG